MTGLFFLALSAICFTPSTDTFGIFFYLHVSLFFEMKCVGLIDIDYGGMTLTNPLLERRHNHIIAVHNPEHFIVVSGNGEFAVLKPHFYGLLKPFSKKNASFKFFSAAEEGVNLQGTAVISSDTKTFEWLCRQDSAKLHEAFLYSAVRFIASGVKRFCNYDF